MNPTKSRAELKSSAREFLRGKYPSVIPAMLMVSFLSSGIKSASALLITPSNLWGYLLYYIISILCWTFSGMFSVGIALYFLNICCRHKFSTTDLFYGFTYQPKKTFLTSLIFSCLNFLSSIPMFFVPLTTGPENMELYLKESTIYFAVLLGCNALYTLITLCFSQVYYLMLDFPELSVKQLFLHNVNLMKGNLWRFLLLDISFIPLLLLGVGSCSIGFLWIVPYIQATYSLFYLDLMQKKATS